MSLKEKELKSLEIIERAFALYDGHQAVTFTGGKDSLVVLHMVKRVCGGYVPVPVLNIDTTVKFDEIYYFRDLIASQWNLNLLVRSNSEAAARIAIGRDKKECCRILKIEVLAKAICEFGFKAILTGVRWDEHETRQSEIYFSEKQNPCHIRVNPLLHFMEADIWDYISIHDLPYCSLYDQGYRSLGCKPCTVPGGIGPERQGRSQDKEQIMKDLRQLGYF